MRYVAASLICLLVHSGCGNNPQPPAVGSPPQQSTPGTIARGAAENSVTPPPPATLSPREPKSRQFTLHYKFRVKDLKSTGDAERDTVRVWIPLPSTNEHQKINPLPETAPVVLEDHQEGRYGNRLRYLQLPIPANGEFTVDLPYEVVRHEVRTTEKNEQLAELGESERAQLLAANELVPITGKPLELLKDLQLSAEPNARARQLYDLVDEHVVYKKEGTGWGRGDTDWVCENGYGNCTDFHSLFISLARSQNLPARFEIGFSIPTDKREGPISGYHCWAWFHTRDRSWVPVDISEADKHPELKEYYFGNLTADRVMFTTGRDLELQPTPAHRPLNFLIFPYIEVGGETLAKENVELQFSFKEN